MNAFEWYALSKMGENLATIVNDGHGDILTYCFWGFIFISVCAFIFGKGKRADDGYKTAD